MPLLVDSDVLIEYLRGRPGAVEFVEGVEDDLLVSVVTLAELLAGVRDDEEHRRVDEFRLAIEVAPVTEEIARQAGALRRQYLRSHGLALPDAFIAATALSRGAILVTFNRKHFPMVPDVLVPYERT